MVSQDTKLTESRVLKQQTPRMPEYDNSHQKLEDKSHKAIPDLGQWIRGRGWGKCSMIQGM